MDIRSLHVVLQSLQKKKRNARSSYDPWEWHRNEGIFARAFIRELIGSSNHGVRTYVFASRRVLPKVRDYIFFLFKKRRAFRQTLDFLIFLTFQMGLDVLV